MDNDVESCISENYDENGSEEYFHDMIETRKDNHSFSEDETESKSDSRTNLTLDLRNVSSIGKSDDETSEKLSAVIEQPEELVSSETVRNEETESFSDPELNKNLCKRINTLHHVIIDLREEMKLALSLWRKERDEFQLLRERSDIIAVEEATAAARAAAEAYAAESPLSNELVGNVVNLNPVQSLSELTILEYEKKLAKYQDALALAQAEKRYNMRKKAIANTYQQRLLEIERMCNEELENIRQSTNILQPLRQIASQWSVKKDSAREIITSLENEKKILESEGKYDRNDLRKNGIFDAEINMIPESLATRFSYSESTEYEQRLYNALRSAKSSHSHLLVESNSSPSTAWHPSSSLHS